MAAIDLADIGFDYSSGNLFDAAFGGEAFSLEHFSLHVPHGQVTVLLGPSGCGKSTILRIIAGLVRPSSGSVLFNGREMEDVSPGERRIGMVFQNLALYPHLDSGTNIASFFFFRKKTPALDQKRKELLARTTDLLGVKLDHLLARKPPKLSGGEQQRVAMGRCITREPELLLLDEPFSNLDTPERERYRVNLRQLLSRFNVTTVYVTHDQREAMLLADNLVLLSDGRVVQSGTPQAVYDHPGNLFVAEFLADQRGLPAMNFFEGETIGMEFSETTVGVRPSDIVLTPGTGAGPERAAVLETRLLPLDNSYEVTVGYKNITLAVRTESARGLAAGAEVAIAFRKFFVFNRKTEKLKQVVVPE